MNHPDSNRGAGKDFRIKGISKNLFINKMFVRLSLSNPYQTSISLTFSLRQAQADRVFRNALFIISEETAHFIRYQNKTTIELKFVFRSGVNAMKIILQSWQRELAFQ